MDDTSQRNKEPVMGIDRLREEHDKVVKGCNDRIQHWKKVSGDYEALNERLSTLPDQLSYDIMVPFGPLAFMPGKLVHTNEVTVLLGDNWFAKCSTKQAQKIVDHRMKYVKNELDGLLKTRKNFEARVNFTKDLENISDNKGDYVDIREDVGSNECLPTKAKHRVAHKPHSKPKLDSVLDVEEVEEEEEEGDGDVMHRTILSEEELWARLDELERLEEQQDEHDRMSDLGNINGEESTTSSSEEEKEEEEKDGEGTRPANELSPSLTVPPLQSQVNGKVSPSRGCGGGGGGGDGDDDESEEGNSLPTIYFSHTVEPKKVRINTGKNTMFKFSERKEQKDHSKRKKNGNGHSHHEFYKITTPADLYRLFVDVKNGEPVPRKSILKSRSRENSVCSDTSESSAADFEERRTIGRSFSHDEATHSDASDGVAEDDSPTAVALHPASHLEAFSGTVVEKDPMPSAIPHLTISPPALPTILEKKQEEVGTDVVQEPPKRVSKFKAARLHKK